MWTAPTGLAPAAASRLSMCGVGVGASFLAIRRGEAATAPDCETSSSRNVTTTNRDPETTRQGTRTISRLAPRALPIEGPDDTVADLPIQLRGLAIPSTLPVSEMEEKLMHAGTLSERALRLPYARWSCTVETGRRRLRNRVCRRVRVWRRMRLQSRSRPRSDGGDDRRRAVRGSDCGAVRRDR